jgi:cytochrome c553
MRIRIIITLLMIVSGLVFTLKSNLQTTITQTTKTREIPDVIVLSEKAVLGKVTFKHGEHATKNYNLDGTAPLKCVDCHHVEQAAREVTSSVGHMTAYPANRTVTLTSENFKDPKTPEVTSCRKCHLPKDAKPTILTEIPQTINETTKKPISLTSQNALHTQCTGCHEKVMTARPTVKAPKTNNCVMCHKKA